MSDDSRLRDARIHVERAREAAIGDGTDLYRTITPARASLVREHLRFADELLKAVAGPRCWSRRSQLWAWSGGYEVV
jgi:hypothetical protein